MLECALLSHFTDHDSTRRKNNLANVNDAVKSRKHSFRIHAVNPQLNHPSSLGTIRSSSCSSSHLSPSPSCIRHSAELSFLIPFETTTTQT